MVTTDIMYWTFTVVPPSPDQTSETAQPVRFPAGSSSNFQIQMRVSGVDCAALAICYRHSVFALSSQDTCKNKISVGGDGARLSSSLTPITTGQVDGSPGPATAPSPVDNLDGRYNFNLAGNVAGTYSLAVRFDNIIISSGRTWNLIIDPGTTLLMGVTVSLVH